VQAIRVILTGLIFLAYGSLQAQEMPMQDFMPVPDEQTGRELADDPERIYERVEIDPTFPEGNENLSKWLKVKIGEVRSSKRRLPKGNVVVKILIEKNGKVGGHEFQNPTHKKLKTETTNIINEMPKWNPAYQNGRPVRAHALVKFDW
jgi:protein TonB